MTTTIGIVGSRSWTDYAAFRAILSEITKSWTISSERPMRIVSGGAKGVDWVRRKHYYSDTLNPLK